MTRGGQARVVCAMIALSVPLARASSTPNECQILRTHGQNAEAHNCYESLTRERDPYWRAEGFWGLRRYEEASNQFRLAVAQNEGNALYRVRWGRLLHERFNNGDAEGLFKEALSHDPKNAQAYLGLALVSADGFDSKAIQWCARALELDPKLAGAHELMGNLALEDSVTDEAVRQADQAIQISPDALDAYAIRAAVEILADRSPDAWLAKIRAINPTYGDAYRRVARQLELHYRYEDAVTYYRKAIEADPHL